MGMFKQMKTIIAAAALVLMAGLTGFGGAAIASTPDGETPANEGICDVLIGSTPGLYGLCNAYCEAQDLDDYNKEPPNTRILANYNKKRQAGDPDMPCIAAAPCPCWTQDEKDGIIFDGTSTACTPTTNQITLLDTTPSVQILQATLATDDGDRGRCVHLNTSTSPEVLHNYSNLPISSDEAKNCYAEVSALCDSL